MIISPIGPYCLTSTTPDFVFGTDDPITFEIKQGAEVLLSETYDPDAEGIVFVRDLGSVFESYLSGSMSPGAQESLSGTFDLYVDGVLIESTTALLCRAFTAQAASVFFLDQKPLHLQFGQKVTLPLATEYLTFYLTALDQVRVSVKYLQNGAIMESNLVTLYEAGSTGFWTMGITLRTVGDLFADIDTKTILSYKVGAGEIFTQFNVDWNFYTDTKVFRYLNSFGVPASFCTRGEIARKRSHTFQSSRVFGIEKKFAVERTDTFKVDVGRKFSRVDDLLIAEMTQADLVQVYFRGSWFEIVITEEDSSEAQRPGAMSESGFTFRFADRKHNAMLEDPAWILENGNWRDWGSWFDDGLWND